MARAHLLAAPKVVGWRGERPPDRAADRGPIMIMKIMMIIIIVIMMK